MLTLTLTESLTHSLIHWFLWTGSLMRDLTVLRVVEKFPTFYSTWFFTSLTKAILWSLYWAIWHQSMLSHSLSIKPVLILHSHLCLGHPRSLHASGLCTTILFCTMFATGPSNLILLNLISLIICGKEYKSLTFCLCTSVKPPVTLNPLTYLYSLYHNHGITCFISLSIPTYS